MKSFSQFIVEQTDAVDAGNAELIAGIESAFKKYFPHGRITVADRKSLGRNHVMVNFGMIGNVGELQSRIPDNDPMSAKFMILGDASQYEAERSVGIGFNVEAEAGSRNVMGSEKIPFRKAKGDTKKMIAIFDTHFKRLKDFVKSDGDRIYRRKQYDDKYFK